jgi:hypothetical protein
VAFVGDTTFDVGAARAAGLPVVAVSFGFHDLPPPLLGADAVIDHFDALVPTLAAWAEFSQQGQQPALLAAEPRVARGSLRPARQAAWSGTRSSTAGWI